MFTKIITFNTFTRNILHNKHDVILTDNNVHRSWICRKKNVPKEYQVYYPRTIIDALLNDSNRDISTHCKHISIVFTDTILPKMRSKYHYHTSLI